MRLAVELEVYDGPLDLLLSLIEKNKINIFDIPIVEITDQYLAYVRQMESQNLDVVSEFMVMAAELIAIKCRMLLPADEEEDGDEEDPREALVRRLLEYKTCRCMAEELKNRMGGAARHIYKEDSVPPEVRKYRPEADPAELIGDLTLEKLHEVFSSVIRRQTDRIDPVRSRFGTIEREEVSLPDKLEQVAVFAKRRGSFSFRDLISGQSSKTQMVVTFLAVLELISYGYIRVSQKSLRDDIEIQQMPDMSLEQVRERFGMSDIETEEAAG